MEIGVCIKTGALRQAKQAGFDFAELSGMELVKMDMAQVEALHEQARLLHLPVKAVNFYCDQTLFSVNEEPDRERVTDYARQVCERMKILGAGLIGIGSPSCRKREEGVPREVAQERLLQVLTWTGQVAAPYQITVMLEPVNHFLCNTVNSAAQAKALLSKAEVPNLAMLMDFCHAKLMQEKDEELKKAVDVTAHVHIGHQDVETHSRDFLSEQDMGELERQIALLLSGGYHGDISMEAGGAGDLLEGLMRSHRCAKKALDRIVEDK